MEAEVEAGSGRPRALLEDERARERVGLSQRHELLPIQSAAQCLRRREKRAPCALQRRSRLHHQLRHVWDSEFDGARDGAGVVASVRPHLRHLEVLRQQPSHRTPRDGDGGSEGGGSDLLRGARLQSI